MALNNKQKDKMRHVIRITMIAIALILLFWALVLPIINNAVALGVENELLEQPLPPKTQVIDSISAAGRFSPFSKDMQYFGAILLKSDLTKEEMESYLEESLYEKKHNCTVEFQASAAIQLNQLNLDLTFDDFSEGNCYILYKFGFAPGWVRPLLNTDMR